MVRLAGKVALITGGVLGPGAVEDKLFRAKGAKIYLTDVLVDRGLETAANWQALITNSKIQSNFNPRLDFCLGSWPQNFIHFFPSNSELITLSMRMIIICIESIVCYYLEATAGYGKIS